MEYKLTKTIETPGWNIHVYSPVISAEERKKRMNEIYKAAENLLKKVQR